jgi:hypothetical protein
MDAIVNDAGLLKLLVFEQFLGCLYDELSEAADYDRSATRVECVPWLYSPALRMVQWRGCAGIGYANAHTLDWIGNAPVVPNIRPADLFLLSRLGHLPPDTADASSVVAAVMHTITSVRQSYVDTLLQLRRVRRTSAEDSVTVGPPRLRLGAAT